MEVEREEFEWKDIKVIIEKRKKEPPLMKSKEIQTVPKIKDIATATCNIGVTAMNQECQTQLAGIDKFTQTPDHGVAEEIKRVNQKRILAKQRRLKQAKEEEKLQQKKEEKDESQDADKKRKRPRRRRNRGRNKNKNNQKDSHNENFRNKIVAVDCEMVGVSNKGKFSVLARACVVSGHGEVLIDEYCSSKKEVTDYRTHISGIEEKHMKNAQSFYALQNKVKNAIAGKIVVGHGLSHDFQVLRIDHPKSMKRDTAEYFVGKFKKNKRPGLKTLARDQLGLEIQSGAHSPVIDAKAALDIYLKNREEWEAKTSLSTDNKENIPRNQIFDSVERNKPQSPSEYDESDIDEDLSSFKIESDSDITTDSEVYVYSDVYTPFPGFRDFDTGSGRFSDYFY